jgi:hypothetical protein
VVVAQAGQSILPAGARWRGHVVRHSTLEGVKASSPTAHDCPDHFPFRMQVLQVGLQPGKPAASRRFLRRKHLRRTSLSWPQCFSFQRLQDFTGALA